MLGSAQALSKEGNRLKMEMTQFLDMIRTGVGERRERDDPAYEGPERRTARRENQVSAGA